MAENTAIAWTDATFNPWWGCAKVSPGCDNCYAERDAGRFDSRTLWGVDATRRTFGEKHWNEPRRWNRKAEKAGARLRVFCASMADVFDKNAPEGARGALWKLIRETPMLDWLILTKRIGNARAMLPTDWGAGYANAWLGASIVNQLEADRDVPKLEATPARVRFLSCEPLLGPVSLTAGGRFPAIDWVIVGGESGSAARAMDVSWAEALARETVAAGSAFFLKQLSQASGAAFRDYDTFPETLRIRQWPASTSVLPAQSALLD